MVKYFISLFISLLIGVSGMAQSEFVKTSKSGNFILNGRAYYYAGTNFWYGPILGSKGRGGNRSRLNKELDADRKSVV